MTSSRAGSTVVRSWGRQVDDVRAGLDGPISPYWFPPGFFHACAKPAHPPTDAERWFVTVEGEQGVSAHRVSAGSDADTERAASVFDDVWGHAELHEPSASERLAAMAYAWWPIALTALLATTLVVVLGRRWLRRRSGAADHAVDRAVRAGIDHVGERGPFG